MVYDFGDLIILDSAPSALVTVVAMVTIVAGVAVAIVTCRVKIIKRIICVTSAFLIQGTLSALKFGVEQLCE